MDEHNPYQAPAAVVEDMPGLEGNNSGLGAGHIPPAGVRGWSWGAFLLNWIWSVGNGVWIGLVCLVPYVGFFMAIYLGVKGRELAWRAKRWESVEHFQRVQRRWSFWALLIIGGIFGLGIVAAIAIPQYVQYQAHAHAAAGAR